MTSLFYIEHANGKVSDQSLKAITAASQIEGDVHGLIVCLLYTSDAADDS